MSLHSVDPRGSHWAVKRANTKFRVLTESHPRTKRSPVLVGIQQLAELTGYSMNTINCKLWGSRGVIYCPVERLKPTPGFKQFEHIIEATDSFVVFTRINDGE